MGIRIARDQYCQMYNQAESYIVLLFMIGDFPFSDGKNGKECRISSLVTAILMPRM